MKFFSLFERYGGASKGVGVWYHGTAPWNARSILKKGLVPDAPTGAWKEDPNANWSQSSRQSYGGIYITTNLLTAIGAAHNGAYKSNHDGELIVIMNIQPRTAVLDEDNIRYFLQSPHPVGMQHSLDTAMWLYTAQFSKKAESKKFYREALADYKKNFYTQMEWRMGHEMNAHQKKRVDGLLDDAFKAALLRRVVYGPSEASNWKYKWPDEWNRGTGQDEESAPTLPSPAEGEAAFRNAIDALTKTLKSMVVDRKEKSSNQTARLMEPIGFSGANKIVAIVHLENIDENKIAKLGLLYGNIPQDFFDQYNARMGWKTQVIDKRRNGSVVAEGFNAYEEEPDQLDRIISEFEANPNGKQAWNVVPFARVKKIWEDYAKTGFVRDERGMDSIAQQVAKNVIKLYVNTILLSHTPLNPLEYLEDAGYEWDEEKLNKFADYATDSRGQWHLSDRIDRLLNDVHDLEDASSAEDKLLIVDRIFNAVHPRGDLASHFIEGGTASLNKLSG